MSRILALDPGSSETGWAIIDHDPRHIDAGKWPNSRVLACDNGVAGTSSAITNTDTMQAAVGVLVPPRRPFAWKGLASMSAPSPRHGRGGRFVSAQTPLAEYAARFWSRVDQSGGPDACWPWTGRRENGYGWFWIGGRDHRTHRVSYALTHGISIADLRGEVRHLVCDNPPCVNPAHLAPGTHAENMRDMADRRRSARGERVRHARLTAEGAADIRRRYIPGEVTQQMLADEYGIDQTTVWAVLHGKTWTE